MKGIHLRITGSVQGVGFRPFVYGCAKMYGLLGHVCNDSGGVDVYIAGDRIAECVEHIISQPPPLAHITDTVIEDVEISDTDFSIKESTAGGKRAVDIPIDIRTCDDCLRELHDSSDRRYEYAFINCTNCGPRYTIMSDIPYDRKTTALRDFLLCPACRSEYENPENRRFHAQATCCPECGPHYSDIDYGVQVLHDGGIVAIKGIGGYHLACNARNAAAVRRLRQLKDRDEKPFALMVAHENMLTLSHNEHALLTGLERPIVLLPREAFPDIDDAIAPGLDTIGVMLPYAPIHWIMFEKGEFDFLVMTSGNRKSEPMVIRDAEHALGDIADYILDHNRPIIMRNDDSVLREVAGEPVFIRRSRGYAPAGIHVQFSADNTVACGAMLKNSIAVGRENQVYLSPYIGDISNEQTYRDLQNVTKHLIRMYDIQPQYILCDMHPDYLSTHFAESLSDSVIRVQHHTAHALSCMAENGIDQALAVVYDGVGYGTDGKAWGGEFLSILPDTPVSRIHHMRYMPMPGGDACVRYPLRLAAAVLYEYDIRLSGTEEVIELLKKDVNVYYTSALGRLFDAASAVLGICTEQTYEGQAAMMLEACADVNEMSLYEITEFDAGMILKRLYEDTASTEIKAARFQNTIIDITVNNVLRYAEETQQTNICLSGGCFQNARLLRGITEALSGKLNVYRHRLVPPNDGGIALGQIAAFALHTV